MCVHEHSFLLQYVAEFQMFEMLHFGGNSLIQNTCLYQNVLVFFSWTSWLSEDEKSMSGV